LAYRVRGVTIRELNDSKWIGFSIYNVAALFLLMSPILLLQSIADRVVMLAVMGPSILLMAYLSLSLLFLPKIWAVHQSLKRLSNEVGQVTPADNYSARSSNAVTPLHYFETGVATDPKLSNTASLYVKSPPTRLKSRSPEQASSPPTPRRPLSTQPIYVSTALPNRENNSPASIARRVRAGSTIAGAWTENAIIDNGGHLSPVQTQARVQSLEDLLKSIRKQLNDARQQQRVGRMGVQALPSPSTAGAAATAALNSLRIAAAEPNHHESDKLGQ